MMHVCFTEALRQTIKKIIVAEHTPNPHKSMYKVVICNHQDDYPFHFVFVLCLSW